MAFGIMETFGEIGVGLLVVARWQATLHDDMTIIKLHTKDLRRILWSTITGKDSTM
jgi:hypothetical protein